MATPKMQPFWWFIAPPYVKGEQIKNGGFETGDFSYWTTYCAAIDPLNPHSGNYSAKLLDWGCYIKQTDLNVLVDKVNTIGFWHRNSLGGLINTTLIDITFTDDTTSSTFKDSTLAWGYVDIKHMLSGHEGKTIKSIKITGRIPAYPIWVDDVSLDPD